MPSGNKDGRRGRWSDDLYSLSRTWPLTPESTVFIIGAYQGATALELARLYDPHIWAFEPQLAMAAVLEGLALPKMRTFPFGLAEKDAILPMAEVGNDGATFFFPPDARSQIADGRLVEIAAFLEVEAAPAFIDLAVINCEGYELVLLPHMIDCGIIGRFRNLMVQFHLDWELGKTYRALRRRLSKTHYLLWDHGPAWVAWRLR